MRREGTLYGLMCKSKRGYQRNAFGLEGILPSTFPPCSHGWWCDSEEGFAMHAPLLHGSSDSGSSSILHAVGTIYEITTYLRSEILDAKLMFAELSRRGTSALNDFIGEFALAFWDGRT